jgi:ubiquitin C-terminal hydrolase
MNQNCDPAQMLSVSLKNILVNDRRKGVKSLIRTLMQKVNYFRFLQHNDINEFITLFFDQYNMEVYNYNKLDIRPVKQNLNDTALSVFLSKANKSWYNFVKNENTWFNDLCTGQIVQQIICGHCNKIHHNFETFRVLDVELPPDGTSDFSLEYSIDKFFEKQFINDDDSGDKWVCDECNTSKKSVKSCKLVRTPAMFIISLKRFRINKNGTNWTKNQRYVKIPPSLDLNDFSVNYNENFDLKAIANHMGSMNGGHYNAYCKRDNNWFLIDDEDSRKVSSYQDNNAYTVFFQKKNI